MRQATSRRHVSGAASVGALGAEAVEHQVQVAAPCVRGDPVGRLDDPAVGPDDEGEVLGYQVGS